MSPEFEIVPDEFARLSNMDSPGEWEHNPKAHCTRFLVNIERHSFRLPEKGNPTLIPLVRSGFCSSSDALQKLLESRSAPGYYREDFLSLPPCACPEDRP